MISESDKKFYNMELTINEIRSNTLTKNSILNM